MDKFKVGGNPEGSTIPEGLTINDPTKAAKSLIERFSDLQAYAKEKWAEPAGEKYHTSETQAMAEDDATQLQIEQVEDLFTDLWSEDIAPDIKGATIKKLLEMGREDVVRQIDKSSDISGSVDAESLKRIREK